MTREANKKQLFTVKWVFGSRGPTIDQKKRREKKRPEESQARDRGNVQSSENRKKPGPLLGVVHSQSPASNALLITSSPPAWF